MSKKASFGAAHDQPGHQQHQHEVGLQAGDAEHRQHGRPPISASEEQQRDAEVVAHGGVTLFGTKLVMTSTVSSCERLASGSTVTLRKMLLAVRRRRR